MSNEAELQIAWLAMPRSGSEFLVSLTRSLLGQAVEPASSLTPGRVERALASPTNTFHSYLDEGRPIDYFRDNAVRSVKIEVPFADEILLHVAKSFLSCRYLVSIRSFSKMATSHLSLSWGWEPTKLLKAYRAHIDGLIAFAQRHLVLFVDTDRKELFDSHLFARFIGAEPIPRFTKFAQSWPVVNPLAERGQHDGTRPCSGHALDNDIRDQGDALDIKLRNFAVANNGNVLETVCWSEAVLF